MTTPRALMWTLQNTWFLRPRPEQRYKTNTQLFQKTSLLYKGNIGQWNPRKSSSRQGVKALSIDNRTQKLFYSSNIKRTRTVFYHHTQRKVWNPQSNLLSRTPPLFLPPLKLIYHVDKITKSPLRKSLIQRFRKLSLYRAQIQLLVLAKLTTPCSNGPSHMWEMR